MSETLLYSLPQGEQIVRALLARGLTVIFRPHPFSHEFPEDAGVVRRLEALLAADAAASGRAHLFGPAAETERSIVECINASDAMISDVSSVVSDYLFSGKPFALIAVPSPPDQFVRDFPVAAGSYVVDAQLTNLDAVLDLMLGADPQSSPAASHSQPLPGRLRRSPATPRTSWTRACGCSMAHWGRPVGWTTRWMTTRRTSGLIERVRSQLGWYGREVVLSVVATAGAVLALAGGARPGHDAGRDRRARPVGRQPWSGPGSGAA